MLIKILKIKVEQNNQEFQLENWLSNYNYIHSTTAKLVKEKKDYYWHVLISFESKLDLYSNESNLIKDYKAPIEFNEEIDNLIYQKWFGNTTKQMMDLVHDSLKTELNSMQILNERYSDTLFAIDSQIENMMNEFEALKNELVVE